MRSCSVSATPRSSIALADDGIWIINDNDGGDEATLFLKLPTLL
jgi:hypothetical protein